MALSDKNLVSLTAAEHIGPLETGDNIDAKKVAMYGWDGSNWQRQPAPFIDVQYDYAEFSNPDSNGNYQTIAYKVGGSAGTTVRTLNFTYDGSNNVTSIEKT